jgi:hypothetical protein
LGSLGYRGCSCRVLSVFPPGAQGKWPPELLREEDPDPFAQQQQQQSSARRAPLLLDPAVPTDGERGLESRYWRAFFLLPVDAAFLGKVLGEVRPDVLLSLKVLGDTVSVRDRVYFDGVP